MKIIIAKILVLLGLLSTTLLGGTSQPISKELQLKTTTNKITASRDIHEIVLENGIEVDKGLVKQYQYISDKKAEGNFEFDAGRTFTNRRLVSDDGKKKTVDFYNGDQFALQIDGTVNEINYATTTIEAFDAQTTVAQRWVQTAYASTDFPVGAGDGRVGYARSTAQGGWAVVHDAASGNDPRTDLTYLSAYVNYDGDISYIGRMYLPADTSAIGSGSTITAAELHTFQDGGGTAGTYSIVTTNQASTSALQNSDYSQMGSSSLGDIVVTTVTLGTEYTTAISSPDTNISKTGFTKLGVRENVHDLLNSAATGAVVFEIASSENATAGYRPFYRVTYAAAVTDTFNDFIIFE